MICVWCGTSLIVYPLAPNYCSSACKIEDLEAEVAKLKAEP